MADRQGGVGEDMAAAVTDPSMRRIARAVSWVNVVGFALCQVWNVLCVALPDPVTYGEPFHDLRWLSLLTSLVLCVAAVARRRSVLAVAHRVSAFIAIAAVSVASSLLGVRVSHPPGGRGCGRRIRGPVRPVVRAPL